MVYSFYKVLVFCTFCKLFGKHIDIQFAKTGFNDWKNYHSKVNCNEKSLFHVNKVHNFISARIWKN